MLAGAERPLIVAGGGALASGARAEIVALAERLAAPILVSLTGRSVIDDDHPLAAGGFGMHGSPVGQILLNEADVILNLGCRFKSMATNWRPEFSPAPDAAHIQVNLDASEIGRSFPAALALVADVKAVAADLDAALAAQGVARDWRKTPRTRATCAKSSTRWRPRFRRSAPATTSRCIRCASCARRKKCLAREAIYGLDIGCLAEQLPGSPTFLKLHEPRSLLAPSSLCGMSDAAAGLPVARIVHPERPCVGFVGDGSFQMMLDALPVAAEYKLGVTWCILNDEALGSIWDLQNARLRAPLHRHRIRVPARFRGARARLRLLRRARGRARRHRARAGRAPARPTPPASPRSSISSSPGCARRRRSNSSASRRTTF